jgi:regulator of nonsense transcripts 3
VVRNLPPSLAGAVFHDQIAHKYAGALTLCSFHLGKTSHKRQAHSRAYINFKKPEDVIDFYEDFNGHVFVNERGAQYKAVVEYAPYQRVPKPRSKKDVREGTIFKDPEYLAFVEQLAKPAEYLPSAEIQLERRDAEKAAALASGASKDSVVVTPLMEYVRLRRAAKSTPQRGMSSSAKLAARSGGVSASAYAASQKRNAEKGRPGSYAADSSKESGIHSGVPREELQRKERESLIERRRKEAGEGKDKKSVSALASTRASNQRVDLSKEKNVLLTKDSAETGSVLEGRALQILSAGGDAGSRAAAKGTSVNGTGDGTVSGDGRDPHKREYKRKQLLVAKDKDKEAGVVESGQVAAAANGVGTGTAHSQRNRSSGSPKVSAGGAQQAQSVLAYRATSTGDPVSSGKQSHRQEAVSRSSGRSGVPQVQTGASAQGTSSTGSALDLQAQSQAAATQVERAGKRPPRPQAIRLAGKEQAVSLMSSSEAEAQAGNGEEKVGKQMSGDGASLASEKQDARRLRNKDRPDRPVWTPRRREGVAAKADGAASANGAMPAGTAPADGVQGSLQSGMDTGSKSDRMERSSGRQNGKPGSDVRSSEPLQISGVGGNVTSGKLRYVETGGRGARGGRGGAVPASQDAKGDGVNGDVKNYDGKQVRDFGETVLQSLEDDRKRQDGSLWSESGGGNRQGGRRERNGQAGPKEGEVGAEVASKLVKRGRGPPALGSNEKQVWVAVTKASG